MVASYRPFRLLRSKSTASLRRSLTVVSSLAATTLSLINRARGRRRVVCTSFSTGAGFCLGVISYLLTRRIYQVSRYQDTQPFGFRCHGADSGASKSTGLRTDRASWCKSPGPPRHSGSGRRLGESIRSTDDVALTGWPTTPAPT